VIEQSADVGRGITLTYQRFGTGGSPLVLIAGLGQQLHEWPEDLCGMLAEHGLVMRAGRARPRRAAR